MSYFLGGNMSFDYFYYPRDAKLVVASYRLGLLHTAVTGTRAGKSGRSERGSVAFGMAANATRIITFI